MLGALIILLITVSVGLVLYVYDLRYRRRHPDDNGPEGTDGPETPDESDGHGEICCGRHLICDKQLSPAPGEPVIYYDDEELDRFAGRGADDYSPEEIDEIRSVMITLLPEDVCGWVRSIQLRGINLPTPLRDELFLLLED